MYVYKSRSFLFPPLTFPKIFLPIIIIIIIIISLLVSVTDSRTEVPVIGQILHLDHR